MPISNVLLILFVFLAICALLFSAYRKAVENINKEHQKEIEELQKKYEAAEKKAEDMERRMLVWEKNAITDALTGLHNRLFFLDYYRYEVNAAKRYNHDLQIVYLDIDNLKIVNDSLGHQKGDELLIKFAENLKKSFRDSDIVARVGGDEFAVIIAETNREDAEMAIKRLLDVIERSKEFDEFRFSEFCARVGIASFDPENPEKDLLDQADKAMYITKQEKKRV